MKESSRSQALIDVTWVDIHFEACRPEYEAMLASVGLESGWRVLDAGCGGGSFVPLIAATVGARGSVSAVDLSLENVTATRARIRGWSLPCTIDVCQASVEELPYPSDRFDAVWCANVTQYLTDDGLVVPPHGTVKLPLTSPTRRE
jgi:ubiquinone/menaquinone biosynthesis C-methylase UbiE